MKKQYPVEFVYQLASLLVAVIFIHALYVAVVRPRADEILADQTARMQADPDYVQERSVYVIVRDFEQEACFVLMLWAIAIMAYKGLTTGRQRRLLERELVPLDEGMKILPEDSLEYARQVQALPVSQRRQLLPHQVGLGATARAFLAQTPHLVVPLASGEAHDLQEAETAEVPSPPPIPAKEGAEDEGDGGPRPIVNFEGTTPEELLESLTPEDFGKYKM